jgi:hypothetical protein
MAVTTYGIGDAICRAFIRGATELEPLDVLELGSSQAGSPRHYLAQPPFQLAPVVRSASAFGTQRKAGGTVIISDPLSAAVPLSAAPVLIFKYVAPDAVPVGAIYR